MNDDLTVTEKATDGENLTVTEKATDGEELKASEKKENGVELQSENSVIAEKTSTETAEEPKEIQYYENKYELVTRVAFLCGVQDKYFEGGTGNFIPEVAKNLGKNDKAMLVRSLCLLRNSIEHNYKKINDEMYKNGRAFFALTDYFPKEALYFVESRGIKVSNGRNLCDIICEINKHISDRINNCKDVLPGWINWEYIREMFIMPNGQKKVGAQQAAELFYNNMSFYPYGVYINWLPKDIGNLFSSDYKFAKTLYGWHGETFLDKSNLSDVSLEIKGRIYDFINKSNKTMLFVDCENADPYSLCAMFNCIDEEQAAKINKIILYDDPQAPTGWRFFEQHVNIQREKIEHIMINRIINHKSLLDVKLSGRIFKEYYSNEVESFIIASSDSDFWGVIEELPQANFIVMVEHRKTSDEFKKVMEENNIFYCFSDDFYTGMDDSLKKKAIFAELNACFDTKVFNAMELFEEVLTRTRAELQDGEKRQFYDKYIKTLQLRIDKNGEARIEIKR